MRLISPLISHIKLYWRWLYDRALSDKRIASYLADTFESKLNKIQAEGLRFYVKNRIVTIYGTLYQDIDHEQVIRLASRIVGLNAIVDRIHVIKDVNKEDPNARIFLLLNDRYVPRRLLPA